jgi:hypothetical protein
MPAGDSLGWSLNTRTNAERTALDGVARPRRPMRKHGEPTDDAASSRDPEDAPPDDPVQEASEESFPASDPPSWSPLSSGPPTDPEDDRGSDAA